MFELIVLVMAGTLTALLAGLFFAFSVAINDGLARLSDGEYVRAMQSINRVILNPVFYLTFMGPVLLLPTAMVLQWGRPSAIALALAAAMYIFGTFGLTMRGNVPLNNVLDAVDTARASDREMSAARSQFERPWNRLHTIRTGAAITATILVFVACLL
jgi:uncharacterized membrane protein